MADRGVFPSLVSRPFQWIMESAGGKWQREKKWKRGRRREGSGEWAYLCLFLGNVIGGLVIMLVDINRGGVNVFGL